MPSKATLPSVLAADEDVDEEEEAFSYSNKGSVRSKRSSASYGETTKLRPTLKKERKISSTSCNADFSRPQQQQQTGDKHVTLLLIINVKLCNN